MKDITFNIIAAIDDQGGIGRNGGLAWRLSADLKHFKEVTTAVDDPRYQNVLIMGRKTWESLPEKFKPLPGRINVVLTTQKNYLCPPGVFTCNALDDALNFLIKESKIGKVFVIGGANVYAQAIKHKSCRHLFLTKVKGSHGCDVFFPTLPEGFKKVKESPLFQENALSYTFEEYVR